LDRGDRGGIAFARLGQIWLGPADQTRNEAHHRRGNCAAFCGCASGARRYCGFSGACSSGTTAPMRATQAISGAGLASTVTGTASSADKPAATSCAAEPAMQEDVSAAAFTASRKGASRGDVNK